MALSIYRRVLAVHATSVVMEYTLHISTILCARYLCARSSVAMSALSMTLFRLRVSPSVVPYSCKTLCSTATMRHGVSMRSQPCHLLWLRSTRQARCCRPMPPMLVSMARHCVLWIHTIMRSVGRCVSDLSTSTPRRRWIIELTCSSSITICHCSVSESNVLQL